MHPTCACVQDGATQASAFEAARGASHACRGASGASEESAASGHAGRSRAAASEVANIATTAAVCRAARAEPRSNLHAPGERGEEVCSPHKCERSCALAVRRCSFRSEAASRHRSPATAPAHAHVGSVWAVVEGLLGSVWGCVVFWARECDAMYISQRPTYYLRHLLQNACGEREKHHALQNARPWAPGRWGVGMRKTSEACGAPPGAAGPEHLEGGAAVARGRADGMHLLHVRAHSRAQCFQQKPAQESTTSTKMPSMHD